MGAHPQGEGHRAGCRRVDHLSPDAARFADALAHWDAGRARDAHEAWEVLWRALPRDGREARFLKGLLCGTAYVVKRAEGSPVAHLLLERAETAFAGTDPGWSGVDAAAFLAEVRRRAGP